MSEIHPIFDTVRVLKPPQGFEQVYQGLSASIPVAFPGVTDPLVGQTGYDPYLETGVPVPLGSRIVLWIPLTLSSSDSEGAQPQVPYEYQIAWRLRNVQEYLDTQSLSPREQKQYSLPTRAMGLDTAAGDPRVIVPCAFETVAYEQTEPGTIFTNARNNLRGVTIVPDAQPSSSLPRLVRTNPGTPGALSQGCFVDDGTNAEPIGINYVVYETIASGNELLILSRRATIGLGAVWDFSVSTADRGFSNAYGTDNGAHAYNPALGIFLITGTP